MSEHFSSIGVVSNQHKIWFIIFFITTITTNLYSEELSVKDQVTQKSLLDLYQTGGSLMHFILLCSIGTIAASTYCFIHISKKKMIPNELHQGLRQYAQDQDVESAYEFCRRSPSVYSQIICSALLKYNPQRDLSNKSSMEQSALEAIDRTETEQMLWINYLNIFSTVAPMLGLLGTVTGMINSFDQLSAGNSEPADLAGGIGEAMITTAAGLIVGIPAIFLYFLFRNRLDSILSKVQQNTSFIIDLFTGDLVLEKSSKQPIASTLHHDTAT